MHSLIHTIHVHAPTIDFDMINSNDAVLFWQDGVLIGLKNNAILSQLQQKTNSIYALENDLTARGLLPFIDENIKIISLSELVDLTKQYFPQKCWF